MARLTILTVKELHTLYGLPQFTDEERDIYFALDPLEKQQLDQLRNITTSIYFILQLGYFKAKKQFFVFGLQEVSDDGPMQTFVSPGAIEINQRSTCSKTDAVGYIGKTQRHHSKK